MPVIGFGKLLPRRCQMTDVTNNQDWREGLKREIAARVETVTMI